MIRWVRGKPSAFGIAVTSPLSLVILGEAAALALKCMHGKLMEVPRFGVGVQCACVFIAVEETYNLS